MNVKRFVGKSAREALNQVRDALGEDAVILVNRAIQGGVEVLATAMGDVERLAAPRAASKPALSAPRATAAAAAAPTPRPTASPPQLPKTVRVARPIEPARSALPAPRIYTLAEAREQATSFGDYLKATARHYETDGVTDAALAAEAAAVYSEMFTPQAVQPVRRPQAVPAQPQIVPAAPVIPEAIAPAAAVAPAARATAAPAIDLSDRPAVQSAQDAALVNEMRMMKRMLAEQMAQFAWHDMARRSPAQGKLLCDLIGAGFSPMLSRKLAEHLPADMADKDIAAWSATSITKNINVPMAGEDLLEKGGVHALVGPTGVGKTTTVAKLAARAVLKYGASKVGLITVDNFRIAARDQLSTYGKILGVQVQIAQDGDRLAQLVASMRDKHLVLIDTVGLGQRDERLVELQAMLAHPAIRRVLVLNATAQAEMLEDVVQTYGRKGVPITGAIITKMDEAVKMGQVVDCVIRHRLTTHFVTCGQRVPEDIHVANGQLLAHRALKRPQAPAFEFKAEELSLVFASAAHSNGTLRVPQ